MLIAQSNQRISPVCMMCRLLLTMPQSQWRKSQLHTWRKMTLLLYSRFLYHMSNNRLSSYTVQQRSQRTQIALENLYRILAHMTHILHWLQW